ncbi:hypothetical protein [Siphonobacter sp. SORGH_AS_0500]|uniref:hypothetical protein n=1 Tax=Siphonobacter sp. SORGH_AS_0500 TaxID=1864824 RepID=UPI00285FA5CE|nr:hypothetical protein [Siphonobacter sp. SORGH_AS_0500]MDR6198048.1 hypothetical protein [Siphonobacter sp. SORGH_AS_0500]
MTSTTVSTTSGVSQWAAGIQAVFESENQQVLAFLYSKGKWTYLVDTNSLWIIYAYPEGPQFAIRACFDPQGFESCQITEYTTERICFTIQGSLGLFQVSFAIIDPEKGLVRYTNQLKTRQKLFLSALPRDLYPQSEVDVKIAQKGPAVGLLYFDLPGAGSALYIQNFTSLNPYFESSHTEPTNCVGGEWPELGFALPPSQTPLKADQTYLLSDAFLVINQASEATQLAKPLEFIESLALIYDQLPKTPTSYVDWPSRAQRTLISLNRSKACKQIINQQVYLNAYVDSYEKPPESMVQLAILIPLLEYEQWKQTTSYALSQDLMRSIPTFFKKELKVLTRWLPGVKFKKPDEELSEEEKPEIIDSWYLLHILINTGRLASFGHEAAHSIFFESLSYLIKAAHHFNYEWPVFYYMNDFSVMKAETEPGAGGEHDVPGLYIHVMLQAYEFTKEEIYLEEAEKSAQRLLNLEFSLLYQSNNTIMSGVALARLWKITNNRTYLELSYLCVANILAKMWLWECDFGYGKDYSIFMGLSPLRDAEYISAYEEAESLAALTAYVKEVHQVAPRELNYLLAEYGKYLLHRGQFFYPDQTPPALICMQPKEGTTMRNLSIPIEDLRSGWQQSGQVGQEVYGAAMAFVLTSYAYHSFPKVPFQIFVEYPVFRADFLSESSKEGKVTLVIGGSDLGTCKLRLLSPKGILPYTQCLVGEDKNEVTPCNEDHAHTFREYELRGGTEVTLTYWS